MGVLRILGGIADQLSCANRSRVDPGNMLECRSDNVRAVSGRGRVDSCGVCQEKDRCGHSGTACHTCGSGMLHTDCEPDCDSGTCPSGCPGDMVQVQMNLTILYKEYSYEDHFESGRT